MGYVMEPEKREITRLFIHKILLSPLGFDWSLQGFGMLRLYLSKEVRLHIWDGRLGVKDVSTIHNHPWSFTSEVIVGRLRNIRYELTQHYGAAYKRVTIRCGPGGGLAGEPEDVNLVRWSEDVYLDGERYSQLAAQIHESIPAPGTVTLVTRKFRADTEHADVFYPADGKWVSAEPRPATPPEILEITKSALSYF